MDRSFGKRHRLEISLRVPGISEDDEFAYDQYGNQVFRGCSAEEIPATANSHESIYKMGNHQE